MRQVVTGTSSGRLIVSEKDGLLHARGVPYATASRFRRPVPVATSDIERNATDRGPVCIQSPGRLDGVTGRVVEGLEQSEACLVLSVTAPIDARNLPVMVWFHGGAYVSGGGEAPKYDGDLLAREGVVVVSVTYRLGGFGYLAPVGFSDDNLGLRDQIEAVKWVAANVHRFGGDPAVVTLFGQSAGADSILSLMGCPDVRRLFQRAIVQSAPLGLRSGRAKLHEIARAAFSERLGSDGATASASDVLAAESAVTTAVRTLGPASAMPFGPIVGTAPMQSDFDAALRRTASHVELLIGRTRDDAAPFVARNEKMLRLNRLGVLARVLTPRIIRIATSKIFGVEAVAKLWREAGGRVATYRVDWAPRDTPLGSCHCIELPMLFGDAWAGAPMLAGQAVPEQLASHIRRTWATFAREGIDGLEADSLVFE